MRLVHNVDKEEGYDTKNTSSRTDLQREREQKGGGGGGGPGGERSKVRPGLREKTETKERKDRGVREDQRSERRREGKKTKYLYLQGKKHVRGKHIHAHRHQSMPQEKHNSFNVISA